MWLFNLRVKIDRQKRISWRSFGHKSGHQGGGAEGTKKSPRLGINISNHTHIHTSSSKTHRHPHTNTHTLFYGLGHCSSIHKKALGRNVYETQHYINEC